MVSSVKASLRAAPWLWIVAVAVGVFLRLDQIALQIVADDEWHSLHAIRAYDAAWIFTHFGAADYCIPLALYYKAMLGLSGLSEIVMRAPMLACGIAALALFPWMIRKIVGGEAPWLLAATFAALLAISPLHVYFSRYARPYMIAGFLAFLGILAFYRWWEGHGRRWAVLYVTTAILAPYFHLTTIFLLLAPLPFALGDRLRGRRAPELPGLPGLVLCGLTIAAGLAALLGPPFWVDDAALGGKMGSDQVRLRTVEVAVRLVVGVGNRKAAVVVLCQVLPILLLRPVAIQIPIVLARYTFSLLPIFLLLLSVALTSGSLAAARTSRRIPPSLLCGAVATVLFLLGPIPRVYYRPNNWTNHAVFQYYVRPCPRNFTYEKVIEPPRVPAFYESLGERRHGEILIVEAPWDYCWQQNLFPFYQRVHRQRTAIGFVALAPATRWGEIGRDAVGFRFRNFVHLGDLEGMERRGVRFVVIHKNLQGELPLSIHSIVPAEVSGWIQRYREICGKPFYEDEHLVVFDFDRRG